MTTYAIMREARTPGRRPRRMTTVTNYDEGVVDALSEFVFRTYLTTWHRQYAGHRIEWRSERNLTSEWRPWTPGPDEPKFRGREYSVVVTLRNGRNEHEARFYAWKDER